MSSCSWLSCVRCWSALVMKTHREVSAPCCIPFPSSISHDRAPLTLTLDNTLLYMFTVYIPKWVWDLGSEERLEQKIPALPHQMLSCTKKIYEEWGVSIFCLSYGLSDTQYTVGCWAAFLESKTGVCRVFHLIPLWFVATFPSLLVFLTWSLKWCGSVHLGIWGIFQVLILVWLHQFCNV